jgi:hypothetical protein
MVLKTSGQYVYGLAWDKFHGEEFGDELNETDCKAC